jgi:hypothetical protein
MVSFHARLWVFALVLAVAVGFVLHRPSRTQGVHERGAPAASATYAAETVVVVPTITIYGSRSAAAESAP